MTDIKVAAEKLNLETPWSPETELWMARVLQYFHIGLPKNLRAPRVMDFTRLQDRNPNDSGSRRDFGGDRRSRYSGNGGGGRGGFRGSDRRDSGGGGYRDGGRPSRYADRGGDKPTFNADQADRPSFADRPERAPSADRPSYGDRPQRPFGDRPARPYGGDRPARSFERPAGDRPERRDRGSLNERFSEDRKSSSRFDYSSAPVGGARKEGARPGGPRRDAGARSEW